MSDEYHDSGNFHGSLVNASLRDTVPEDGGKYPPLGDTTSEGGSGGDVNSPKVQRGLTDPSLDLIQSQRTPGGLSTSLDNDTGEEDTLQTTGQASDGPGYGRMEAESRYQDRRSEGYESSAAGIVDSSEIGA